MINLGGISNSDLRSSFVELPLKFQSVARPLSSQGCLRWNDDVCDCCGGDLAKILQRWDIVFDWFKGYYIKGIFIFCKNYLLEIVLVREIVNFWLNIREMDMKRGHRSWIGNLNIHDRDYSKLSQPKT